MPTYSTLRGSETWIPYAHPALSDSRSSVASDATAPNLPGAGRVIGLLFYWLGARFEAFLNRRAARLRLGPEAVAQKIRCLRRHNETSIFDRLASPKSKQERKVLRKLCKKLVNYVSAQVLSTQLVALDEIVALTVEDSFIRMMLGGFDLNRLAPKYREPCLILLTSKVLGSLENTKTHYIWTTFVSSRGDSLNLSLSDINALGKIRTRNTPRFSRKLRIPRSLKPLFTSLRNPEVSYLGARYLANLSNLELSDRDVDILEERNFWILTRLLWFTYVKTALREPHLIEWENMDKCLQTHIPYDDSLFLDPKEIFSNVLWRFRLKIMKPEFKPHRSKQFEQYMDKHFLREEAMDEGTNFAT